MDGSVGKKLREARTRRKLSLVEVEAATKIRPRYLQAIENEDWEQLPSETYARAFIRTYGRLLGLDGERLAEEQRRSQGAARPGERLPRVDPGPRPVSRARRRRRAPSGRFVAAAVTALVIAALLVVGLTTGGGSNGGESSGTSSKAHPRQPSPQVGEAVRVR